MVCCVPDLFNFNFSVLNIYYHAELILEDASVTQSALEEALASNMQAGGGMASRMSSISQALRSKYL
jgi:hypothetical protein